MREGDERLDGLELDAQTHGVAERPVRIGERAIQIGVLVGRRGDHLPGAGEDVHLQHRLVRQPVAERRRLDAEAGDRAAEGDGLQLRHDRAAPARRAVSRRRDPRTCTCRRRRPSAPQGRRAMTSVSPDVSRPLASVFARVRNRFEVRLASRTGASPGRRDSSREGAPRRRRERCVRQSQERTRLHASPRPIPGEGQSRPAQYRVQATTPAVSEVRPGASRRFPG